MSSPRRARVEFTWQPYREDTQYRVQVYAGAKFQGKLVFEHIASNNLRARTRLNPGRYTWGILIEESPDRAWPALSKAHTFKVQRKNVVLEVPRRITFD